MRHACIKCKGSPNIKINVLLYCNECFIKAFENKVFKTITKVTPNTKICVFLDESSFSIVLYNLLYKYFKDRPFGKLAIFCENSSIFKFNDRFDFVNPALSKQDFETTRNDRAVDFLENNGYDIFIYPESLESIVLKSLELVCLGKGREAVERCSFQNAAVINPFREIKNKEICYYIYLNKIKTIAKASEKSDIAAVLLNFLSEVDGKNGLALFNVLSTFKKLD